MSGVGPLSSQSAVAALNLPAAAKPQAANLADSKATVVSKILQGLSTENTKSSLFDKVILLKDRVVALTAKVGVRLGRSSPEANQSQAEGLRKISECSTAIKATLGEIRQLKKGNMSEKEISSLKEVVKEWQAQSASLQEAIGGLKKSSLAHQGEFKELKSLTKTLSSTLQSLSYLSDVPTAKAYLEDVQQYLKEEIKMEQCLVGSGLTTTSSLDLCRQLESMNQSLREIETHGFSEKVALPQEAKQFIEDHPLPRGNAVEGRFRSFNRISRNEGWGDDQKIVDTSNKAFNDAMKNARPVALVLHAQIKEMVGMESSINPDTGITCAPLTHLKVAFEKSKEVFGFLHQNAYSPEQQIEVERLTQILLCGNEASSITSLSSPFGFEAKESVGKSTAPQRLEMNEMPAIQHLLEHFVADQEEFKNKRMHYKIDACIDQFCRDVIGRGPSHIIHYGSTNGTTRVKLESNLEGDPCLFKMVKDGFCSHLLKNTDQIKGLQEKYRSAPFLLAAQAIYGKKGEDFSPGTIANMFDSANRLGEKSFPHMTPEILGIIEGSLKLKESELQPFLALGYSASDIENLVAAKAFESIILVNQASVGYAVAAQGPLAKELVEDEFSLTYSTTDFIYGDQSFSGLKVHSPATVRDMSGPGFSLLRGSTNLHAAAFDCGLEISDINESDAQVLTTQNLRFSSLAPPDLMDRAIGFLDETFAKTRPPLADQAHALLLQSLTELQDIRSHSHSKILKELKADFNKTFKETLSGQQKELRDRFIAEVKAQKEAVGDGTSSKETRRSKECDQLIAYINGRV